MIDYLLTSYLGAVLSFLIGIIMLWKQSKENVDEVDWSSPIQGYIKGWFAGIFCILGGVMIVLAKLGVI